MPSNKPCTTSTLAEKLHNLTQFDEELTALIDSLDKILANQNTTDDSTPTRKKKLNIPLPFEKEIDAAIDSLKETSSDQKKTARFLPLANTRFLVSNTPEARELFDRRDELYACRPCLQMKNGKPGPINETRQASVLQNTTSWPRAKLTKTKRIKLDENAFDKVKKNEKKHCVANAGLLLFRKHNNTSLQKASFKNSRRNKNK